MTRSVHCALNLAALAVRETVLGKSRKTLIEEGRDRGFDDLPEKKFLGPF